MVINITSENRKKNGDVKIYDGLSYAKYVGTDAYFEHFVVNNPDNELMAIRTAPGAALLFMISARVHDTDKTTKELMNVLCERLCKDEKEYKKCFNIE